ncbi:hypothetical protein NL108_006380 [Boleophthalmus pectinirostris]|nr:hypothetical protein NL108_006380 [Boleophthalmus pectinirostris]
MSLSFSLLLSLYLPQSLTLYLSCCLSSLFSLFSVSLALSLCPHSPSLPLSLPSISIFLNCSSFSLPSPLSLSLSLSSFYPPLPSVNHASFLSLPSSFSPHPHLPLTLLCLSLSLHLSISPSSSLLSSPLSFS